MPEVSNLKPTVMYPPAQISGDTNIEAHYSDNMKVTKPKVTIGDGPKVLPKYQLLSPAETNKKFQQINTDIYEGYNKEKKDHGFNFSTFFKIFGGISIVAIILACLRGGKK